MIKQCQNDPTKTYDDSATYVVNPCYQPSAGYIVTPQILNPAIFPMNTIDGELWKTISVVGGIGILLIFIWAARK